MTTPTHHRAWLIIREYGQPKRDVALTPDRQWTIGRQKDCSIILRDRYVSRVHAVINSFLFANQPLYFIADYHSRNGTLINGLLIRHSTLLHHEDVNYSQLKQGAFSSPAVSKPTASLWGGLQHPQSTVTSALNSRFWCPQYNYNLRQLKLLKELSSPH